jgi:hypothetical protein
MDIIRVAIEPETNYGKFNSIEDAQIEIALLESDFLVLDIVQYLNKYYVVSSDWMKENKL